MEGRRAADETQAVCVFVNGLPCSESRSQERFGGEPAGKEAEADSLREGEADPDVVDIAIAIGKSFPRSSDSRVQRAWTLQ